MEGVERKDKMVRKSRKVIVLLLSFVVFLTSCSSSNIGRSEKNEEREDKIQIGMSFDSFVIERWQRDRDVFVSMAKELGAEVNVQNANGDIKEQKKQIDYFIKKGTDVIVIICIDGKELKEEVQKAKNAGIKVIAYDRLIKDANVDLYISFDNDAVGRMMGEALVDGGIEGGSVLMLGGPLTDNNVSLVEGGFIKVMEDNNISIMDSMHADGWLAELAGNYIYDHIDEVSEVDAIMCGNDNLASKVVHALSEKRLAGKILVVGQDADLEACQRIVEGTQVMTVYKPVEKLAKQAAEYAVALVKGEKTEEMNLVYMSDGTYEVPYVGLEPISVTKENMNEVIINSGFHLKEDVYLNVPFLQ